MQQLLPPNHSPLQQKGLLSEDQSPVFDTAISNLTNMKADPHDAQLMWLVWEYGLESILPYSQDLRQTLKDGLAWQRIRGTPKSLTTALSWIELNQASIENTPPGRHYYSYQIDAGTIPGDERLEKVVMLAELSAPASSQLTRVYHGYDVRKQMLSNAGCQFGNMLSDYSGVLYQQQGKPLVKVSFGRSQKHYTNASVQNVEFGHHRERAQSNVQFDYYKPMRFVRYRVFSQQRTLAQREWRGPWHDRWQNASWQTQQLCSVQIRYERTVNASLSFSGASTGRMNYGTLNLTAVTPD